MQRCWERGISERNAFVRDCTLPYQEEGRQSEQQESAMDNADIRRVDRPNLSRAARGKGPDVSLELEEKHRWDNIQLAHAMVDAAHELARGSCCVSMGDSFGFTSSNIASEHWVVSGRRPVNGAEQAKGNAFALLRKCLTLRSA
jgi:hypothetical protein